MNVVAVTDQQICEDDIERLYSQVDTIMATITRVDMLRERLLAERNGLLRQLFAAGERQSTIARRVGMTPMNVGFATGRYKQVR